MARILIVDDDRTSCDTLVKHILDQRHTIERTESLSQGLDLAERYAFDIVFLDSRLPDGSGIEALPFFTRSGFQPEVIVTTGKADPNDAASAIKNGAWEYLPKPLQDNDPLLILNRALAYRAEKQNSKKPEALKKSNIIGSSPLLLECLDKAAEVCQSNINVLITGETGTGKEMFARAIHQNSPRRHRNLVVVDCTVLPENLAEDALFGHLRGAYTGAGENRTGLVSQADGGTLFLDEVGDLSKNLQKALLRVLQERKFRPLGSNHEISSDFRLITATHRNLSHMVVRGDFRQDLFYRLSSFVIELPALRNRTRDIEELAAYYMRQTCLEHGFKRKAFSSEFREILEQYQWPGNVRELMNAMNTAVLAARHDPTLYAKHLPQEPRLHRTLARLEDTGDSSKEPAQDNTRMLSFREYRSEAVKRAERHYLSRLMAEAKGNIAKALKISGLGRSRLYALLKEHGLAKTTF